MSEYDWLKPDVEFRLTEGWVDWPAGTRMFVLVSPNNGVLLATPKRKSSISTHVPISIIEPVS